VDSGRRTPSGPVRSCGGAQSVAEGSPRSWRAYFEIDAIGPRTLGPRFLRRWSATRRSPSVMRWSARSRSASERALTPLREAQTGQVPNSSQWRSIRASRSDLESRWPPSLVWLRHMLSTASQPASLKRSTILAWCWKWSSRAAQWAASVSPCLWISLRRVNPKAGGY